MDIKEELAKKLAFYFYHKRGISRFMNGEPDLEWIWNDLGTPEKKGYLDIVDFILSKECLELLLPMYEVHFVGGIGQVDKPVVSVKY